MCCLSRSRLSLKFTLLHCLLQALRSLSFPRTFVQFSAYNLLMDAGDRIQAAAKFLLQSPPGEINDVLNGES